MIPVNRQAAGGTVNSALLRRILVDPYFNQPPTSTGRERFNLSWLVRMSAWPERHSISKCADKDLRIDRRIQLQVP